MVDEVAVGVARGIRHFHEDCKEKIVHYDVKLTKVLLDAALTPKLVDVGLARLVNRDTHVTLCSLPSSPGYVAPEIRVQPDITEKCDVYSFGMLLLEMVGRRRIHDEAAPEGQRWSFPELAWSKYESGDLMDLVFAVPRPDHTALAIGDDDVRQRMELVQRMCKVAFWCVQQQPTARPPMGDVVKMLEGEMDIDPPANPFRQVLASPVVVAYLRTKVASSGNMATAKGPSNDGGRGVIDLVSNIIQSVIS